MLDSFGVDRFRAALADPVRRILARDDLMECGVPRPGNNVAESWYLYFDGTMSIVLFKVPMLPAVQPHASGVVRFAMRCTNVWTTARRRAGPF